MRTAGVILDIYDDLHGRVLREKVATSGLPEKLASSRLLDPEEVESLPDRLFALVGVNQGVPIRKYAMHNEAHLVTSIIYFMECGHLLPEETQTKVAGNLVNACAWYDLDPPDGLVKRAMLGALGSAAAVGLGALELSSKAKEGSERKRQQMDEFRRAQTMGAQVGKVAAGAVIQLSPADDAALQSGQDMPSHVQPFLAKRNNADVARRKLDFQMEQKEEQAEPIGSEKKADLTGTEVMPIGTMRSKSVRTEPNKRIALPAKTAMAKLASERVDPGWQHAGDLSAAEPPARVERTKYAHFALPHRGAYPIDTPELVKTAEAYFDEHITEFPLLDRRIFAQSLHLRSQELGVKLAGQVLDYAGHEYGPYVNSELHARAQSFQGTGHEVVYETLLEKRAEIPPVVMVELLKRADDETGASESYGRPGVGFRDPYAAVYGAVKVSEERAEISKTDNYSWVSGSDYVNGIMLDALAAGGEKLDPLFGEGFTKSFRKDPVGIFESMPDPQKVVLARMASDNTGNKMKV